MATMREIKRRKTSIQSTQQITKAMKVVSSAKLQKAKAKAEGTKSYFDYMYATVSSMLAKSGSIDHPYLKAGQSEKKAIIAITSNRGLAGGYNSNVVKLVTQGDFEKENTIIYPVGRKGLENMQRLGYTCDGDYSEVMNKPLFGDAVTIGKTVTSALENGEIDEVYLAYTVFKNTVTQIPTLIKILPFGEEDLSAMQTEEQPEEKKGAVALMNYEPE